MKFFNTLSYTTIFSYLHHNSEKLHSFSDPAHTIVHLTLRRATPPIQDCPTVFRPATRSCVTWRYCVPPLYLLRAGVKMAIKCSRKRSGVGVMKSVTTQNTEIRCLWREQVFINHWGLRMAWNFASALKGFSLYDSLKMQRHFFLSWKQHVYKHDKIIYAYYRFFNTKEKVVETTFLLHGII